MSGKEIFEAVCFDIRSSRNSMQVTIESPTIRDIVDSMDVFQKDALYDIVGAVAEPKNYIWSENKKAILKTAIGTMNEEQKAVLYACVVYAKAMFAH